MKIYTASQYLAEMRHKPERTDIETYFVGPLNPEIDCKQLENRTCYFSAVCVQVFLPDCKLFKHLIYLQAFWYFSTGTLGALQLLSEHYKDHCWTRASAASCQKSHWDDSINCSN